MAFKGILFEVWQWEQEMFDGSTSTFERLKRPDTAQVIATVGDKILSLMQKQPDSTQAFPSIPGGRCDEREEPLASAKRELLEETGYTSDDWRLWKETEPFSKMEWTVYTYIARNCTKVQEPHLDAGEKIELKLISFDELLALTDADDFYDRELVEPLLRARYSESEKQKLFALFFGDGQ